MWSTINRTLALSFDSVFQGSISGVSQEVQKSGGMGCSSSKTPVGSLDGSASSLAKAASQFKFENAIEWHQIHSAIRWNKNEPEIMAMLMHHADNSNLIDPKTGNSPLHIASQNGHGNLVDMLITYRAAVNCQNLKGQTPMHMAVGYDYYNVAVALKTAGADDTLVNQAGHAARHGLDGDKSLGFIALVQAKTADDVAKAFVLMEAEPGKLNKAEYVKTGLRLKKEIGEKDWPLEKFKAVLNRL